MFSCKCLNVVVRIAPDVAAAPRFDLEAHLQRRKRPVATPESAPAAAGMSPTPSDGHSLFFKEALGPVRCTSVQVQFDALVRTVRLFDEWDLYQCRNCECCVFARLTSASSDDNSASANSCLVNSSLVTNEDQLNARMADGSYSPAFGIVLNGSRLSYSDLTGKSKLLSMAKSDNTYVQLMRAYMERETEAANARIHRFTEQEFAVLKVKRERAEQDCMIVAKLANNVPELMLRSNSITERPTTTTASATTPTAVPAATAPAASSKVSPNGAANQLETPPPTPEYQPMSTGNSPPMATRTSRITPPSSTDQSARQQQQQPLRPNGNNNIVSFSNNTRGAIVSRQQSQPQHSSTNSLMQMQQ